MKKLILLSGMVLVAGLSHSAVTLSSDFAAGGGQQDPIYNFWKVRNEIPAYPGVVPQQPPEYHDMNCIRLLGGWVTGGTSNVVEDIVTWDIGLQDYVYDWDKLTNRIDGVLSQGYGIHQLVLDNPPWCFQRGLTFSANPGPGEYDEDDAITTYGNSMPPGEPDAWHDFITALMNKLIEVYGQTQVEAWRFRVHTEADFHPHHWAGTKMDYFEHYSNTAHAVRSVLPTAKLAAHFLRPTSGVDRYGPEFVTWCSQNNVPYDFIGITHYPFYDNSNQVDVDRLWNLDFKQFVDAPGWNTNAGLEIPEYTLFTEKDDDGYNMGVGTSHNPAFVAMLAKMIYENSILHVHNWGDHYNDPVYLALEGMLGKNRYVGQKTGSPADADNEIDGIFAADASRTAIDAMIFSYNPDPIYIADETVNLSFTVPFPAGAAYEYRIAVCDQANNPHYQFVQEYPLAGLWENQGGWVLDTINLDTMSPTDKNGWLDQILNTTGKNLWNSEKSGYPGYQSLVWSGWTNILTTAGSGPGDSKLELTIPLSSFSFQKIEFRKIEISTLPEPWQSMDIGDVAALGNASFTSGVFTVNASGADIWNTADEFHYVYRPVQGDCEIIARVTSVENTHVWAKAGVMIRETLASNAVNVATVLTAANGVAFQQRSATDALSINETAGGLVAPYWVRLTRVGDTFTGYRSANGTTWSAFTSATIPMATNVYIGLASTSHDDGTIGTSVFDSVDTTFAPIAWAGLDQTLEDTDADGIETFMLDGSGSTASDNESIVEYLWYRGSMLLATGETANVELPLGTHLVTLQVMDNNGAVSSDWLSLTVAPSPGTSTILIAGWEIWSHLHAGNASYTDGVTASYTDVNAGINGEAASTDGTWGTLTTPVADATNGSTSDGTWLPNGVTGHFDFTLTDTTGIAGDLVSLHFDSGSKRPNSARNYTLEVLSGDLTIGTVASGTVPGPAVPGTIDWYDYDIDLTGLADHELDANGTVVFRLSFSGPGGGGGHHQTLDNVGITRLVTGDAYPDSDGNGLPDWWEIYYLGSTGQVAIVDSDSDGLTNEDELTAGTDPGDSSSVFAIHGFEEAIGGGYTVYWDSYSDRTYDVLKAPGIVSNAWTSASGGLPGTGGEMSFTDSAPVSPSNRFYKVQVTQP